LLPDGRLWISGGYADDQLQEATSYVMDTQGNFQPFFSLPQSASQHCVVIVDDRTAIVAMGFGMTTK